LVDELSDFLPEGFACSLGGAAERAFELCEGHFDGVEIGRVGRQEQEFGATRFYQLSSLGAFVTGQIIEDDDVAWRQFGDEELPDILNEDRPGYGTVDDKRCNKSLRRKSRNKGGRLPMSVRRIAFDPLAPRRSSIAAHHVGGSAGLIDEEQPPAREHILPLTPLLTRQSHVCSELFAGVHGFF